MSSTFKDLWHLSFGMRTVESSAGCHAKAMRRPGGAPLCSWSRACVSSLPLLLGEQVGTICTATHRSSVAAWPWSSQKEKNVAFTRKAAYCICVPAPLLLHHPHGVACRPLLSWRCRHHD